MSSIDLLRVPQSSLGTGPLQHEPALPFCREGRAAFLVEPPLLSRWGCEAGLLVCCLLAVHGSFVGAARGQPSKRTAVNGRGDGVPRAAIMRARDTTTKSSSSSHPAPKSQSPEARVRLRGTHQSSRHSWQCQEETSRRSPRQQKHVSTRDAIGRCEAHGWPTQCTLAKRCAASPAIPANRAARA